MSDETSALAEYGHNPKYPTADQRAPASAAEVEQRRANKALHSERVRHGGNPGAGERVR